MYGMLKITVLFITNEDIIFLPNQAFLIKYNNQSQNNK